MREPLVMRDHMFYPGVCVGCGVQNNRRWYVEIGVDLDFHFNPMNEGNIIFCNECWNSLVKSVNKYVKAFVLANKGTLGTTVEDEDGPTRSDPVVVRSEPDATDSNRDVEPDSSENESTNVVQFASFFSGAGTNRG
jgi:hypothetical protein